VNIVPGEVEAADALVLGVGPPPAQTASWSEALGDTPTVTTVEDPAVLPGTHVLQTVDCVVARYDTPHTSGASVVDAVAAERPNLPVVLAAPAEQATAALDAGATDVIRVDDGRVNPVVAASRIEAVAEHADGDRKFRDAIERVDDAFFALDANYRVTYANQAGADVLRGAMGADYERHDLVGRHLWEEIPDAVGTPFYEAYTTALETQEPVSFEAEYEPLDAWFDVRAHPAPGGLSVYFTDITERKERERVLNGVLDATQSFFRADSVAEVVAATMDAAERALGEDVVSLRLADEDTGLLRVAALSDAADDMITAPPEFATDEGPPGRAFQTGQPVVVDDLSAETDRDYGTAESGLFVPVGDHGVIAIGALEPAAFGD
jgi:PAS domain S-box-containing protein